MRIGTGSARVVRFVQQPDVLLAVVAKAVVMNTTGRGRSRTWMRGGTKASVRRRGGGGVLLEGVGAALVAERTRGRLLETRMVGALHGVASKGRGGSEGEQGLVEDSICQGGVFVKVRLLNEHQWRSDRRV